MIELLKSGSFLKLKGFGELPKSFIYKLYGLGLYKGAVFTVSYIAPLGCPIALQVGNTLLSIRRDELNKMQLEVV